jgi:hypothetical protein
MTSVKITHTYLLATPILEGENHLKGGRFVTSQNFKFERACISYMCIMAFLHLGKYEIKSAK